MKRKLWYLFEFVFDVFTLMAVNVAFLRFVHWLIAMPLLLLYMIALNAVRLHRLQAIGGIPNRVELPGTFTILAKSNLAVDLNGRSMQFHRGEGVEIKVPEDCSAVAMKFIAEPNEDVLGSEFIQ